MTDGPVAAALLGCRELAAGHRQPVVTGVSLEVRAGEAWFLVGANGAGKSTLVAVLLGLVRPLHGSVLPPCGGDRAQLGYVPQPQRFDAPLPCTVAELVAAGLRGSRRAVHGAIDRALARMGVQPLRGRDARALSVGQARRVAIARALAREPRLLVLDEPAANLDTDAVRRLAADLDALRAAGLAVVHVSHDLDLAAAHATHVALLAGGRVRCGGPELLRGRVHGSAP